MSVSAEDRPLLSLAHQRNAIATNGKKAVKRAAENIDKQPQNTSDLLVSKTKLKDYRERYSALSASIQQLIPDEDRLMKDLEAQAEIDEEWSDMIARLDAAISLPQFNVQPAVSLQTNIPAPGAFSTPNWSVKLPTLDVEKFSGDPMKWCAFKETFLAVVDAKPMPVAQKFRYLKSYLEGEALRMLDGYLPSEASYDAALKALQERYGDPNLGIFAHLSAMIEMKGLSGYDVVRLTKLRDDCEYHIRSLVALGLDEATFEKVFTPLILSKLPLMVRFQLNKEMVDVPWSLEKLRELLRKEIRTRDMSKRQSDMGGGHKASDESCRQLPKSKTSNEEPRGSASMLPAAAGEEKKKPKKEPPRVQRLQRSRFPCQYCGGHHFADLCTEYPDIPSRLKKLGTSCRRCLNPNHRSAECRSIKVCRYCDSPSHSASLCSAKFGADSTSTGNVSLAPTDYDESEHEALVESLASEGGKHVHLQTAVTAVRNVEGTKEVKARLLFDTAASRSFVTERTANLLEVQRCGQESMSIAGFEQSSRRSKTYDIVKLEVLCRDGKMQRVEARVTQTLTCPISKPTLDLRKYPAAVILPLAEPCVDDCEMQTIDILIGADHYYDFVSGEVIKERDGMVFISSRLGYLTSGASDDVGQHSSTVQIVLAAPVVGAEESFDLQKFWRIEELGIRAEELTQTSGDEEALFNFQKSVKFENGRYSVTLPWKEPHPELQSHYHLCKGRLRSVVKRLKQTSDVLAKYDQTVQDQLAKGVIELVPAEPDGPVHYIPHFEVLTPQKTTTKLRVVYDCSAKLANNDVSLNECLFRGPVVLENMCGMLIRFRLHNIGIISDIEKAFLQISIQVQDRDVLRFLWLRNINHEVSEFNLVEYRFARVLFGANSSPSLLGMTVDHHLRSTGSPVCMKAAEDMFVDNNVTGVETVEEGVQYYKHLKEVFQRASMNLREWFTNNEMLRQQFELCDRGSGDATKVLGVQWHLDKDSMSCSGKFGNIVTTKRHAISSIATLFDPCGWFGPAALPGKLLIREIWRQKCEWDEQLPNDILDQWRKLEESLALVEKHCIPRRATKNLSVQDSYRQLHCFVDASAQAYAAAVYLRCEKDGFVETALLFSKSRVCPLKQVITIPKLELMAAALGVDLVEFVRRELRCDPLQTFVWSDSQCVLHWIKAQNKATVFVANRLKKIKAVPGITFRYVNTDANPADVASRGTDCRKLVENDVWWKGPAFLALDESQWPQWEVPLKFYAAEPHEEAFAVEQVLPSLVAAESWIDVSRFSNMSRLLRTVAYVKRFIHNSTNPKRKQTGLITASEIEDARYEMDKLAQTQLPGVDADEIQRRMQLAVFVDDRNVLRCKSRLAEADLSFEAMYPTLLASTGDYMRLVIREAHERAHHAGVAQTLAKVREKYWITRGRVRIKNEIRGCRVCRRISGAAYKTPTTPSIPWFRVSKSPPFQCVGLDYLGPLLIKELGGFRKVWICLMTCAVTRGVHLEVVEDMTACQFLLAFRRFAAKYGLPKIVVSDNAKQFSTGLTALAKIWHDVTSCSLVQNFSAIRGIRWKFITEKAPWFGGFYERLVGSVKGGLKRALNLKKVSLIELQTVICEVAAVINDRPLVYLEDEPGQLVLTPAHFFKKGPATTWPNEKLDAVNDEDYVLKPTTKDDLIREYKRIRNMVNSFWQIWQKRYLINLRNFSAKKQRNAVAEVPAVGDVVLIVEVGQPRGVWKIAKVVSIHESQDGQVRSAIVKTAKGNEV